jgi:hypothetical protein
MNLRELRELKKLTDAIVQNLALINGSGKEHMLRKAFRETADGRQKPINSVMRLKMQRKASGLCTGCGLRPSMPGILKKEPKWPLCDECREKRSTKDIKRMTELKAQGLCTQCGQEPFVTGSIGPRAKFPMCRTCREKRLPPARTQLTAVPA